VAVVVAVAMTVTMAQAVAEVAERFYKETFL
jgi:hypothetical protein